MPLPRMSRFRLQVFVLLLGVLLVPCVSVAVASAQDVPTPVALHPPLLAKILAYDRNFAERAGAEVVVGVLYQPRYRASFTVMQAFLEASKVAQHVKGRPVRCIPIVLEEAAALQARLEAESIDALYITPLRAIDIDGIAAVSRTRRVLTFTGVPAYVEAGIAVGVGLTQNKPKILVNLPAARAEGAAFQAHLLKLAHVISE